MFEVFKHSLMQIDYINLNVCFWLCVLVAWYLVTKRYYIAEIRAMQQQQVFEALKKNFTLTMTTDSLIFFLFCFGHCASFFRFDYVCYFRRGITFIHSPDSLGNVSAYHRSNKIL